MNSHILYTESTVPATEIVLEIIYECCINYAWKDGPNIRKPTSLLKLIFNIGRDKKNQNKVPLLNPKTQGFLNQAPLTFHILEKANQCKSYLSIQWRAWDIDADVICNATPTLVIDNDLKLMLARQNLDHGMLGEELWGLVNLVWFCLMDPTKGLGKYDTVHRTQHQKVENHRIPPTMLSVA